MFPETALLTALETFGSRIPRRLIEVNRAAGSVSALVPYLYRSYLEGQAAPDGEPGLLLHKFVADDEVGKLHSHPWQWSVSFILSGSYRETRARCNPREPEEGGTVVLGGMQTQILLPGERNYIMVDDYHRVELMSPEVWTLFLHGPRVADWGFVPEVSGMRHAIELVSTRVFAKTKVRE